MMNTGNSEKRPKLDFLIRKATGADAEGLIKYAKVVFGSTDQLLTSLEEYAMTVEEEIRWIDGMNGDPNALLLIAEHHDTIIGMLFFKGNSKLKNAHSGEFGINVHPDFQRKGVGERLVKELIAWASDHPRMEKVYLTVLETNRNAIILYSKLGFKEEGRHINAVKQLNGDYVNVIQMYYLVKHPGDRLK